MITNNTIFQQKKLSTKKQRMRSFDMTYSLPILTEEKKQLEETPWGGKCDSEGTTDSLHITHSLTLSNRPKSERELD